MNFRELDRRFIDYLRQRVRSGTLTERNLARITGFSQPHIHNVLSGKRRLSMDAADTILAVLGLDIRDLLLPEELSQKPRPD